MSVLKVPHPRAAAPRPDAPPFAACARSSLTRWGCPPTARNASVEAGAATPRSAATSVRPRSGNDLKWPLLNWWRSGSSLGILNGMGRFARCLPVIY